MASSLAPALETLQRLSPRPHQAMLASMLALASRVGKLLQTRAPAKPRGLFRRRSSSSKKKLKKDRRLQTKAQSAPRHFSHTAPQSRSNSDSKDPSPASLETAVDVFCSAVQSLQTFVETFAKTHKFVFHLASMRRMYLDLQVVGGKLDSVVKLAGLKSDLQADNQQEDWTWQKQLMADREQEEDELSKKAAKNALPFARNMLPHEPMEALTLLKFEIDYFKPGNSTKHVASMKKVFFSVVRSSNGRVAKIPDWYIPPYALNYSRDDKNEMKGSVGTAHRGVWVDRKPPDGKKPEKDEEGGEQKASKHDVVVKRLFFHADAIELFRQEVELWFQLDHPNILKLYGASHCSRPALLVYEDATNGPLVSYLNHQRQLRAQSRRERRKNAGDVGERWPYKNQGHALWCLFLEAARGLRYLHMEKRLVHGNLKSDNILVTSDGQVKLTDFGLGMLALQNQAVQDKHFEELGWRAPNCRQKKVFRRPSFQDDIYSFGLCVLDVLVPQLSSIAGKHGSDAPTHVGEEGFDPLAASVLELIYVDSHRKLVVDMCQIKPDERLTLDAMILRLTEMRDAAAQEPADSSECCIL